MQSNCLSLSLYKYMNLNMEVGHINNSNRTWKSTTSIWPVQSPVPYLRIIGGGSYNGGGVDYTQINFLSSRVSQMNIADMEPTLYTQEGGNYNPND